MASRASREVKEEVVEEEEKPKKPDLRHDFNRFMETVLRTGRTFSPDEIKALEERGKRAKNQKEMEQLGREVRAVRPARTAERPPIMSAPTELKPEALAWALALAEGFETSRRPEDIGKALKRWVSTKNVLESGRG